MRKWLAAMLLGVLIFHVINIPAKAATTTKSSCNKTQFLIVLKNTSELKEKANQESATIKVYEKDKKLSVIKRSGNWYQICDENEMAYVPLKGTKEVFNAEQKKILSKASKKKEVGQVVAAIGKKMNTKNVTIQAFEKKEGEWRRALPSMKGVIGKNGFTTNKKEGDGKSPIGMFAFGTAFGSKSLDKLHIPYKQTTKYDYWIDDVRSNDYNKWKTYKGNPTKKWKSFERMNHELYKYGAVIQYNMNPIVKGKGSAIFLHVWRSEKGVTAGCVATSEKNVLTLLRWMDSTKRTHIIMGTPDTI